MIRFALAFVFIVASLSAATVRNPMPGWMAPPGASGGGGGGAAIHDSLASHGLGADSSAWFKSVNRVISVGPEWGDSTPGAQVGIQAAVDQVCANGGTVYEPDGEYLFTDRVLLQNCMDVTISRSPRARATMQDGAWTLLDMTDSAVGLPGWKSLYVMDGCTRCKIIGGKMDMAGLVHDPGTAGSLVIAFRSLDPVVEGVSGGNVNPTVAGRATFGGWAEDGIAIRYDGIVNFYSQGSRFEKNNLKNIKYAAISGRCATFGNQFLYNRVADAYEGIQSAGFGGVCARGANQTFIGNEVWRYRAQMAVSHDSNVVMSLNRGYDGTNVGTDETKQNCILATDGAGFLISNNYCLNPYPIGATGNTRGAIGFSNVRDVFASNNFIEWDTVPGNNINTIAYGFEEGTKNITISGGEVKNVGVCVYQRDNASTDTNLTIDGLECNNIRYAALLVNGNNGLKIRGGTYRSSETLSAGIRLNWGILTDSVTAKVDGVSLEFDHEPTNGFLLGNGVNSRASVTNVYGYNPQKVARRWFFPGNSYPPTAGASAVTMLDSLVCFGSDTASSTQSCITKTGTRQIGSASDTASYPAFKGTHKPTVQAMGDASITVSPLAEVVVTTVSLTGQRDITLDDPAVYGPNRCITIRDAGFINGGNTIGVDPGAFPIDGTPSVMGMSSPYDVLKLCTNNAADGWILEYAK